MRPVKNRGTSIFQTNWKLRVNEELMKKMFPFFPSSLTINFLSVWKIIISLDVAGWLVA